MCIDKRVIGAVAIAAVGLLLVAPQLITSALPVLLIAICPLSMLLMGKAVMSGGQRISTTASEPIEASYRTVPTLDRDQQVAHLQVQLRAVRDQQVLLADQLTQLQRTPIPVTGADNTDGAPSASLPDALTR